MKNICLNKGGKTSPFNGGVSYLHLCNAMLICVQIFNYEIFKKDIRIQENRTWGKRDTIHCFMFY